MTTIRVRVTEYDPGSGEPKDYFDEVRPESPLGVIFETDAESVTIVRPRGIVVYNRVTPPCHTDITTNRKEIQ